MFILELGILVLGTLYAIQKKWFQKIKLGGMNWGWLKNEKFWVCMLALGLFVILNVLAAVRAPTQYAYFKGPLKYALEFALAAVLVLMVIAYYSKGGALIIKILIGGIILACWLIILNTIKKGEEVQKVRSAIGGMLPKYETLSAGQTFFFPANTHYEVFYGINTGDSLHIETDDVAYTVFNDNGRAAFREKNECFWETGLSFGRYIKAVDKPLTIKYLSNQIEGGLFNLLWAQDTTLLINGVKEGTISLR